MMKAMFLSGIAIVIVAVLSLPAFADESKSAKADAAKAWHWPKVTVSKETTYFTGPLRKDGGVNYVAALNERYSKGVTPENNAAVALWQAAGPKGIDKHIRKQFFDMLGIAELPEEGDYLIAVQDLPEYKEQVEKNPKGDPAVWEDVCEQYRQATGKPWNAKDYPLWARVLEQNEKPLKILTDGLQRPKFYSPLVPPRRDFTMLCTCFGKTGYQEARAAARLLKLRAMLRLHDDPSGASQDIISLYRLVRLWSRRPFMTDWVGMSVIFDGAANDAAVALSQHSELTASQVREFQKQFRSLPAMRSLAEFCEESERCYFLEVLTMLANANGLEPYLAGDNAIRRMMRESDPNQKISEEEPIRRAEALKRLIATNDVDWTEVFRRSNAFQDRLAKACAGAPSPEVVTKFAALELEVATHAKKTTDAVLAGKPITVDRMSSQLKAQYIADLAVLPGPLHLWEGWIRIEQNRATCERMTLLAFALVGYRADHTKYPKNLVELVPTYIDAIPKDPFADSDLHYKSEDDGYLIYSVGQNGKDDGGRTLANYPKSATAEQRQAWDWDDVAIRTPTKKAK
jgi:hypothetical protein